MELCPSCGHSPLMNIGGKQICEKCRYFEDCCEGSMMLGDDPEPRKNGSGKFGLRKKDCKKHPPKMSER